MSKMRFFALQELSNRKPLEVTAPSNKLSDYYGSHVFDRKNRAGARSVERPTPVLSASSSLLNFER